MRIFNTISSVLLILLAAECSAEESADYGYWLEPKTNVAVHLYSCVEDTTLLCGRIIGIPAQETKTDVNNPDPSLRNRALQDLEIVQHFQRVDDKVWEGGGDYGKLPGRIYLPANGDTLGDHKNRYRIEIQQDRVLISVANCRLFNCLTQSEWRKLAAQETRTEAPL